MATPPAESFEPCSRREKILLCEKVERHLITSEINMRYVVPRMSLLSKIGRNIFHRLPFAGQFRPFGGTSDDLYLLRLTRSYAGRLVSIFGMVKSTRVTTAVISCNYRKKVWPSSLGTRYLFSGNDGCEVDYNVSHSPVCVSSAYLATLYEFGKIVYFRLNVCSKIHSCSK
nr:unnamed protein product [Callosobruchus chinensis]